MIKKKKVLTKAEAIKLLKLAREIISCSPFVEPFDTASKKYYKAQSKFLRQTKNLL